MENIKTVIKDLLLKELEKEEKRIRESDVGDEFITGYDKDFYHNGVGWALTSAPEPVYDEEELKEAAKDNLIKDLENDDDGEFCVKLAESSQFISCLIDLINEI